MFKKLMISAALTISCLAPFAIAQTEDIRAMTAHQLVLRYQSETGKAPTPTDLSLYFGLPLEEVQTKFSGKSTSVAPAPQTNVPMLDNKGRDAISKLCSFENHNDLAGASKCRGHQYGAALRLGNIADQIDRGQNIRVGYPFAAKVVRIPKHIGDIISVCANDNRITGGWDFAAVEHCIGQEAEAAIQFEDLYNTEDMATARECLSEYGSYTSAIHCLGQRKFEP